MTEISEQDERDARRWAHSVLNRSEEYNVADITAARTILALLERRTMPRPEDVPDDVLSVMSNASDETVATGGSHRDDMRAAYRALYDHYNPPPAAKKVEMWAVYGTDLYRPLIGVFENQTVAEKCAKRHPSRYIKHLVEADSHE